MSDRTMDESEMMSSARFDEETEARGPEIPVERIAVDDLIARAKDLHKAGGRMQMAYARWAEPGQIAVRYVASDAENRTFIIWSCRPEKSIPSLADIFPLIGWYEREIADLFGLVFDNHPEPQRLVLQEGVSLPGPPFDPSFPASVRATVKHVARPLPELGGHEQDVQELPFGPVRAGIVESGEFLFYYVGEHILHFHPQLFFKHRGMEKRFEGLAPEAAVVWAERVSGVGSFSHALAYCQAVEAAAGCIVPKRARWLRVLVAEMERLYNHLHYLGHLADTTTLKVGQADGHLLEEQAKQLNGRLTGSRFLRGIVAPGGLRRDLDPKDWLAPELEAIRRKTVDYCRRLVGTDSFLDRLITTGPLDRTTAFDEGATGPVERASGLDRDLRRDHPYAAYTELPLSVPVETEGDAKARFDVRVAEIDCSIAIMQRILLLLEDGSTRTACVAAPGSEGLGWAENPRGALFYAVHVAADGRLARVKIKSPSFSNWRVFPFTVHGTNMMDYAINEASFGMTIAGCDR